MVKEKFLVVRFSNEEHEQITQIADALTLQCGKRVTRTEVLRRCLLYGMPTVQREAKGHVTQSGTNLSEFERLAQVAQKVLTLGFQQVDGAIQASSAQTQ
jgi:predicted kinase